MPAEVYGYPPAKARAGWEAGEVSGYPPAKARGGVGKMCGVSGALETGEGEQVPPPRRPLPQWRYPHGPAHGEILEKSRARWPTGSTPDTAVHPISQALPPPTGGGGGGAPEARAGWGLPAENVWVSLRRRGRGGGCRQRMYGYPLPEARAGWGCRREVYGYPPAKARAVQGLPAKAYGYPPARRRPAGAMDPVTRERGGTDAIPRP